MSDFERMLDDLESLTADERRALRAAASEQPPRGASFAVWSGLVRELPSLSSGGSGSAGNAEGSSGPPESGPPESGPPESGPPESGPPESGPPSAGSIATDAGPATGSGSAVGGGAVAKGTSTAAAVGAISRTGGLSSVGSATNAITAASLMKSLGVGMVVGLAAITARYELTSTHEEPAQGAGSDAAAGDTRHAEPRVPRGPAATRADTSASAALPPEPSASRTSTRGALPGGPGAATASLELGAVTQRVAGADDPSQNATQSVGPNVNTKHVNAAVSGSPSRLAEESQLLAAARARLRAGDGARALDLLEQARRNHPSGVLVQERDALTIQALSLVGRRSDASERARAFLQRYPGSPHAHRVRAVLTP